MANTTGFETICNNTYLVTRDSSGNILDMIGQTPQPELLVISKRDYRNLFTMAERIGIDGFQSKCHVDSSTEGAVGDAL